MKNFMLIIISVVHFALFGQVIQNGGFEEGPHPNFYGQITRANFWEHGCEFNADLFDCEAEPVPTGPLAGQVVVDTPVDCVYPRNNGLTNCRFGAIRCEGFNSSGTSLLSAAHMRNDLTSNLLPNVNYEFQLWVARSNGTNLPATRRIEAVLRATNDSGGDICLTEFIVPIPTDITFTNCNWMFLSTSFQLTDIQALVGYNWIEIREISRPAYNQERIYIDDVSLLGGINDLGTEEISTDKNKYLKIYPNPASSELHIDTKTSFEKVTITDLMGNVLLETYGSNTVSVESLSAGVYIVQIDDLYSQRFVKN